MTKLIDADKLREQIEYKIPKITNGYEVSCIIQVNDVLKLIDEAPDLSPIDSQELDDAAEDYINNDSNKTVGQAWLTRDVRHAFINGANWQAQHSLTIEELERLDAILYAVRNNKTMAFTFQKMPDNKYKEVLKRFNKQKK